MHRAEFGSAVSPIMTMPHVALILEITPLKKLITFYGYTWMSNLHARIRKYCLNLTGWVSMNEQKYRKKSDIDQF